jgi:uridylate kinase
LRGEFGARRKAAVLLAREHALSVHLFDFNASGAVARLCAGEEVGTLIGPVEDALA